MQDLKGKTAFITGGDSGIGLGIAKAFCEAGMRVVISGLSTDTLGHAEELLSPIGDIHTTLLDVRNREDFVNVADRIDADLGGVDVLVNNAGVGFLTPALETSFEQWDWVMGINLTGTYNGIRTFVPRMVASGKPGHVVSTASIGGMTGTNGAVYAAAKFGVVGLMEALNAELKDTKLSASILAPGTVRTNIAHGPQPPGSVRAVNPGGASLSDIYLAPMEPDEVGKRVVAGILRNDLYIFTHAEHRDILSERFQAILRSVPDEHADPRRAAVERRLMSNPMYAAVESWKAGRSE
jgi:2-hydroxycyclohexanecarboxyl-CoA dehydrogenase